MADHTRTMSIAAAAEPRRDECIPPRVVTILKGAAALGRRHCDLGGRVRRRLAWHGAIPAAVRRSLTTRSRAIPRRLRRRRNDDPVAIVASALRVLAGLAVVRRRNPNGHPDRHLQ